MEIMVLGVDDPVFEYSKIKSNNIVRIRTIGITTEWYISLTEGCKCDS